MLKRVWLICVVTFQLQNVVVDVSVPTKKKGKLRWRKKPKVDSKDSDIVVMSSAKKMQKMAAKKKRKEEARHIAKEIQLTAMDVS